MSQPLLYDLYKEIHLDKQWIRPSQQEYYLLFDVFKSGYKVKDFDDLVFVLETIWLKSHHQRDKFRKLLEKRRVALIELANSIEQLASGKTPDPIPEVKIEPPPQPHPPFMPKNPIIQPERTIEPSSNTLNKPQTKDVVKNDEWDEAGFSLSKDSANTVSIKLENDKHSAASLLDTPFIFTDDYFPVNNRQLQQAWRRLKNKQEGSDLPELNVRKTILHVAKQGFFSEFKFQKKIYNQVSLFILIDRSESMVAVEDFGKQLSSAALESRLHTTAKPLFFYEVPSVSNQGGDYSVLNEDYSTLTTFRNLFKGLAKRNIVVLMYSDCGALKGISDPERLTATKHFINFLGEQASYLSWLNPAPKNRWKNTNAEHLNNYGIPMFECSKREDIEDAVAALNGRINIMNQQSLS